MLSTPTYACFSACDKNATSTMGPGCAYLDGSDVLNYMGYDKVRFFF